MDTWKQDVYAQFNRTVTDAMFPCIFAQKSQKMKTQELSFFDESKTSFDQLIVDFVSFTERFKEAEITERLYTPLLVFVKPRAFFSLKQYHELAWSILQDIHDVDPAGWPSEIPKDPDNYLWSFCFNGIQLFINISVPLHKFHRSRNLGASMVLVVNPRKNFDYVAGNNSSGRKVRSMIRERCERYDGVPLSPSIGFYADPRSLEWRQYQAEESGGFQPSNCPLHIKG